MFYLGLLMLVSQSASSCSDCTSANVTCVDGECLSRCVHMTSSGECQECRDSKLYGKQCELFCPSTCLNSRCQLGNRGPECTDGCVVGKKGVSCGVDCRISCLRCERYGDKCVGSCRQKGYHGDYCNETCPIFCKDGRCDKDSRQCISCKPGYRGRYCECSPNCNECDQHTGRCTACRDGFSGVNCNEVICPKSQQYQNCAECDIDTGLCTKCEGRKFYGPNCSFPCPSHCDRCTKDAGLCIACPGNSFYGPACFIPCPESCKGCYKDTGECILCSEGHSREFCDDPCLPCVGDECLRKACRHRGHVINYILLSAGVLVGSAVVVGMGLCYKCRKRCRPYLARRESRSADRGSAVQYLTDKYWSIQEEELDTTSSSIPVPAPPASCPSPLDQRCGRPQIPSRSGGQPSGSESSRVDLMAGLDQTLEESLKLVPAVTTRAGNKVVDVSLSRNLAAEPLVEITEDERRSEMNRTNRKGGVTTDDNQLSIKTQAMVF